VPVALSAIGEWLLALGGYKDQQTRQSAKYPPNWYRAWLSGGFFLTRHHPSTSQFPSLNLSSFLFLLVFGGGQSIPRFSFPSFKPSRDAEIVHSFQHLSTTLVGQAPSINYSEHVSRLLRLAFTYPVTYSLLSDSRSAPSAMRSMPSVPRHALAHAYPVSQSGWNHIP